MSQHNKKQEVRFEVTSKPVCNSACLNNEGTRRSAGKEYNPSLTVDLMKHLRVSPLLPEARGSRTGGAIPTRTGGATPTRTGGGTPTLPKVESTSKASKKPKNADDSEETSGAVVHQQATRNEVVPTKDPTILITGSPRSSGSHPSGRIPVEERPGWTATERLMMKDLVSHKGEFARLSDSGSEGCKQSMNQLTMLPVHTVLVKWRFNFNFPIYTHRVVHGILSRYGSIKTMGTLSVNSAFVVFVHEYHACRAIYAPHVGFSFCPLICRWWFTDRYKLPMTDPADVKREDLVLAEGRLERNSKRHIQQIRREFWKKAANLSYDVSTFRP